MPNECFGWLWILVGFFTGALMGMRFADPDWLGGYQAFPRRLVRLGHISFLALGMLNILYAHGMERMNIGAEWRSAASWCLIAGGVGMPLCCGLTAWKAALRPLFAVPVSCLVFAASITTIGMFRA